MVKCNIILKDNIEEDAEKEKEKESRLPKGSILHLTGIENGAREDIKEALAKLDAHVAFVDYSRGNESGYVRLVNENEAKTVFEKLEEGKVSYKCSFNLHFYPFSLTHSFFINFSNLRINSFLYI